MIKNVFHLKIIMLIGWNLLLCTLSSNQLFLTVDKLKSNQTDETPLQ